MERTGTAVACAAGVAAVTAAALFIVYHPAPRGSSAAKPAQRDRRWFGEYYPEWLSPDGSMLLVTAGRPCLLDVRTGHRVWQGPPLKADVHGAAWSPASDAICWSDAYPSQQPRLFVQQLPAGSPAEVNPTSAVDRVPDTVLNSCFGRSGDEIVVGYYSLLGGMAKGGYVTLRHLPGGGAWAINQQIALPPDIPVARQKTMLPVGDGHQVLILDGSSRPSTVPRGLYLLDLAHGSLVRVLDQTNPVLVKEQERLGPGLVLEEPGFGWLVTVPDGSRRHFAFGLPVSFPGELAPRWGAAFFLLTMDDRPQVQYVGAIRGAGSDLAVLPGGKGFVVPVEDAKRRGPSPSGKPPPCHLWFAGPDASLVRQLTDGSHWDVWPAWSAATRRIVFRRHDTAELMTVSLKGGDAQHLWSAPAPAASSRPGPASHPSDTSPPSAGERPAPRAG